MSALVFVALQVLHHPLVMYGPLLMRALWRHFLLLMLSVSWVACPQVHEATLPWQVAWKVSPICLGWWSCLGMKVGWWQVMWRIVVAAILIAAVQDVLFEREDERNGVEI